MKKQIGSLILISTLISGCSGQVAMLSSTVGFTASHNTHIKAYNGLDLMTTVATKKDIKTHFYETTKATVETVKVAFETEQSEIKIYNKKYYSGNLTGETAKVVEVKEEKLVSSVTTEPKVEKLVSSVTTEPKVEKQQIMWKLCYLSFFLALAMGSFVIALIYGFVSLNTIKRPRKIKKKRKNKKRKGRR